jgi:hypothetical protein
MVIVYMSGGLGNQMFQYAFSVNFLNAQLEVKYDDVWFRTLSNQSGIMLGRVFGLKCPAATRAEVEKVAYYEPTKLAKIRRKLLGVRESHIVEREFFHGLLSPWQPLVVRDGCYYQGYWQSSRYFDAFGEQIQSLFRFGGSLNDQNKAVWDTICENPQQACAIHIRRGDYLEKGYGNFLSLQRTGYYQKALQKVTTMAGSPLRYYFFSDDIAWIRQNFQLENAVYVDWNKAEESYRDLQLMSACKYIVTANSTFSWWGAYLNPNCLDKVVCTPAEWFRKVKLKDIDLVPSNWYPIGVEQSAERWDG